MRIGIITMPLAYNYGAILQNYALQQILYRLGHIPITIDYLPVSYKRKIKHIIWNLLHFRRPDKWFLSLGRPKFISEFCRQHINTTTTVERYSATIVKIYRLDAIIAGSDQIWRPKYNDHLFDMYFQFVESMSIKKVVYGASFGTDEWEYSSQQTEYCRFLARQINAISVRERSGVDLCESHFGLKANCVLDPTLLMDTNEYFKICFKIPYKSQPFIAAYMLDINEQISEKIENVSKLLNIPLKLFSADGAMSLSIEEWMAMFRDATYVITDSFHGTIFSIIFNKPFISVGNISRGMNRFQSLLEQFNLEERLSPEISADDLLRPIPWERINALREELKEKSLCFLKASLC